MPLLDVYDLSNILFPFISVIATLFDVTSYIFKLKDFNCSNLFVPLPFNKLGHFGHSITLHMEIMKQCIYKFFWTTWPPYWWVYWRISNLCQSFFSFFFFPTGVFFCNHSRITGLQGKGEGISVTPHCHCHLTLRH